MSVIELMPEQQKALDGPGPIRAFDPRTKAEYVLVREDVYRKLTAMLSDDTVYTTAEMLDAVMADDDANDPTLEYYQRKYGP